MKAARSAAALALVCCSLATICAPDASAGPPRPTEICAKAPGGGLTLANVAAAHGTALAVGSNGLIAASRDLSHWTVEPTPLVHNLRGVVWTGERWVAVGDLGSILYRAGGRWVAVPGIPSSGLRAIAARPGLVAAGGSGGVLITSPDGIHWAIANSGTSVLLWGATSVGSTLLLSGQLSTVIAGQGSGWTPVPTFPLATGNATAPRPLLWQLASDGTQVVAVGDFGSILSGTIADGLRAVRSPTSEILRGVENADGRWVAVGSGGTILLSRDGRRWKLERSPTSVDLRGVAWTGRRFVAVGDEGTVISSPNGRSWSVQASAMPCALLGVARAGRVLVAVGGSGRIERQDGMVWHRADSPTRADLYAVAHGPRGFVAVGSAAAILTSADGRRWRRAPSPVRLNLHAVTWTGTEYLAGGDRGELIASADGRRWHRVAFPGFHSIRSFAGGGSAVIVAGAGTVARSVGGSWDLEPVGLGKFQTGVAYGAGVFVIVGHNGEALVSRDGGASWSPANSTVTQNLDAVAWTGTRFVATGENVAIASTDGSRWEAIAAPSGHSIRALALTPGGLVGVGDLGAKVRLALG